MHDVRFGVNSTNHTFEPSTYGITTQDPEFSIDTTLGQQIQRSLETSFYVEDQINFGTRLKANIGLHGVHYLYNQKSSFSFQPRASLNVRMNEYVTFKSSFSQMTQFLHLLTNSGLGLPLDLWLPATNRTPPQRAWQVAGGISALLWQNQYELSIEGYYKRMDGLIAYREGTNFFLGGQVDSWENLIETGGNGEMYGAEFLLQKKQGKTTGWMGYTLSWNWRQFDEINDGRRFPYRYDRRHDISLVISHQFSEQITLSGSWVFHTGNAITLPSGRHPTALDPLLSWNTMQGQFQEIISTGQDNNPLPFYTGGFDRNTFPTYQPYRPAQTDIYQRFGLGAQVYNEGRNDFRMQAYHRLDLGIHLSKEKKWGKRVWSFGIYNTYRRLNPYVYYWEENQFFDPNSQTTIRESKLKKLVLFPIVPSISYQFKF
jgi:hypothetical protein